MNSLLEKKFEKMGARLKVNRFPAISGRRAIAPIRVDIRRDHRGEYFDVQHRPDVSVEVLDLKPAERHLLLMARQSEDGRQIKSKYLCGHDERAWFVAAVPEEAHASSVQGARDALKPAPVWQAMREQGVPLRKRDRRKTQAFVRQGEWFFIPMPSVSIDPSDVLKNEPIRRGAGKPHICQFLARAGGEQVYVGNGRVLTVSQYVKLSQRQRTAHQWRPMLRNAGVYVKGAIRHPDHATVWLTCWHAVVMNTETRALAMRHVAFLD
jgi:hypothetical protein